MKSEAYLFGGVAVFFLLTDAVYILLAREPAGIAALTVSCFMASVISFFCTINYRRKGLRPEDRPTAEIHERAGRIDFFPPESGYPAVTAGGVTVIAIGLVYGAWLFAIGFGIFAIGLVGMVFEFAGRDSD